MQKNIFVILLLSIVVNVNSKPLMPLPMAAGLAGTVTGIVLNVGVSNSINQITRKTDEVNNYADELKKLRKTRNICTSLTATAATLLANQIIQQTLNDKISDKAIDFSKYPLFFLFNALAVRYTDSLK